MPTPFIPLAGHNTTNDMIDYINNVYQYYAALGTAAYDDSQMSADDVVANRLLKVGAFGLGGEALISSSSADDFVIGSFTQFSGTEAECVAANLPAIENALPTAARTYVVLTFGVSTAIVQFATETVGDGLSPDEIIPQFKRVKTSSGWTSWKPVGSGAGAKRGVFYEGKQELTTDYTVPANTNAMSIGPLTIASGVTVTVPPGSVWTIV